MPICTRFVLLLPLVLGVAAPAQRSPSTRATADTAAAANAFLAALDAAEKSKATFAFDSPQARSGWSNLPTGIFERKGLRLGDLAPEKRAKALALVAAALSGSGYRKVTQIMDADEALKNQGGGRTGARQGAPGRGGARGRGGGIRFGKDEYYIALFGAPSDRTPWRLQFGGHHLAINVTIAGGSSVMTPSLPATQPAHYTLNGETIRPLGNENDKAFAFINTLSPDQLRDAVLPYRVSDLVLGPGHDGETIQPEGILASKLTAAQQEALLGIAHEWVGILNDEAANAKMAELKSNLPRTYFAWSGGTKNGDLAYYRIQGPTVVIEYAPQQGDLEHIHTIYRDPTNDYGAKLVGVTR